MLEILEISQWINEDFDLIIDARSPREFKESHVYEAVNFYALNNYEYEQTGKLYKENKHEAKIFGASCVCKNISNHLNEIKKMLKMGSKIGIYCAKGGDRSGSIGVVLSMIGFRVYKLKNGYKAYRNYVLDYFKTPCKCEFITLFGNTGSGKTRLIDELYPSINIEKIANHLGSIFGHIKGVQPNQKAFENEIFHLLRKFEGDVVFIEGESAKLGKIMLPKNLNEALHNPKCGVEVKTPIEDRVKTILKDYDYMSSDFFYWAMDKISPFIKKDAKQKAIQDFENNDLNAVAKNLLLNYYDNVYKKPKKIDFVLENDDFENSLQILRNLRENIKNKI